MQHGQRAFASFYYYADGNPTPFYLLLSLKSVTQSLHINGQHMESDDLKKTQWIQENQEYILKWKAIYEKLYR